MRSSRILVENWFSKVEIEPFVVVVAPGQCGGWLGLVECCSRFIFSSYKSSFRVGLLCAVPAGGRRSLGALCARRAGLAGALGVHIG